MIRLHIEQTIDLTQEQFTACVNLARQLGYTGSNRTAVLRMLIEAMRDKAFYAHEESQQ